MARLVQLSWIWLDETAVEVRPVGMFGVALRTSMKLILLLTVEEPLLIVSRPSVTLTRELPPTQSCDGLDGPPGVGRERSHGRDHADTQVVDNLWTDHGHAAETFGEPPGVSNRPADDVRRAR